MSSPRLGVVRDSMLTNPLHIKAPLGQSRSRGLEVPGPDFTFGISSRSDREGGVAEVLSSWSVQSRRGGSAPPPPPPPDFVSLNRDAVKAGAATSKELSQYRAQGGGADAKGPAHAQRGGGASQRPAAPDITFGVTARPPSPLSHLLSHQYGRRWIDQQLSRKHTEQTQLRVKPGSVSETRTSLLRRSRALPVTHTHTADTLQRYTQVPAALDTFRHDETQCHCLSCRRSHNK